MNRTTFKTEPQAGMVAEVVEEFGPNLERKNLLFLSSTRYGPQYKGAKEGMDASSRTKTNSAVNKAGGSCLGGDFRP